jgi:hypothetical protein
MIDRTSGGWIAAGLVAALALGAAGVQESASGKNHTGGRDPEFWIGAVDPVVQQDRRVGNPSDYMELFQPPTRWPVVAKHTSTLEISTQLVLRGTPAQHRALIDGLETNHLKLAGQFGVEELSPPACGPPSEGQGGPANAAGVAKRTHDLGLPLEYLDMDEPLTWGREAPRNKCPKSVGTLAKIAVSKVTAYRRLFPMLKINLIDAVGGPFKMQVHDEIEFVDMLGSMGVHVDYFIADVVWASPTWQSNFEELATKLHSRGIKVGMFCNGRPTSTSDLTWDRDSVANCKAAGEDPKIAPDLYMIGTWSPYPTKIFPEDNPGTLTHIGKQLMKMFS